MSSSCPPGFGCSDGRPSDAGDAGITYALGWLAETGVLAQAVQPGEMVPDFSLSDGHGGRVDLQALLDRGPLVLLFVPAVAADDARRALRTMQESLPAIEALGASAVVISAAPPSDITAVVDELGLTLPVGGDSDSHVAHLFGLTYEAPEPSDQWCRRLGLPTGSVPPGQTFVLPATYVINSDGTAEYAVIEADLRQRVRIPELLRALSLSIERR